MTVTTLTMPKCTMGEGLDRLDGALSDLDTARFALASLVEDEHPVEISPHVIRCVMSTLSEAAVELKTGLDAVSFEHKAFKIWEAKNAQPAGEARP